MKKIFFREVALKGFLLCALFFTSAFQLVNAQTTSLSGTVSSEDGELLPGASVIVTGTTKGVYTDFDGNFVINVPSDAKTISIRYLGFKTLLIAYLGQKNINVSLKSDNNVLDEIVVVGYGTQRAEDVTGAISKIKEEDIKKTLNTTVEQALSGRIAGVNTIATDGTPGGGIRIRIRGGTSINANNEPLYVIDGLPIEVDYSFSDESSPINGTSSSPLANLDPGSIQSIEVLKDASAAAIYGARGANGVVIITTKTGKAGKPRLTYETNLSLSSVPKSRYVAMMNTSQWGTFLIDKLRYSKGIYNPSVLLTGSVGKTSFTDLTADETQAVFDAAPNTDWQDKFFRVGAIKTHAFGASGGSEGNLYAMRASYLENEGAINNSFFKRYNFNMNLQNKLSDKLKIKTVLAPSYSIKQGPATAGSASSRVQGSVIKTLSTRPDRVVGDFLEDDDNDNGIFIDPITEAKRIKATSHTFDFIGNTNVIYEVIDGLTANISVGAKITDGKTKNFFSKEFGRGLREGGLGTRFHYQNININNQNTLTFKKLIGKHRVNVLAGFTQTFNSRDTEYIQSSDFDIETLGAEALQLGNIPLTPQTFLQKKVVKSYLGRVNYGFASKYNFTLSFRADGTSVFIKDKWGYFPAAAFAWNAHNENFLKNVDAITNLKLRLSYGQTGNAGIPFYAAYGLFVAQNYVFGDNSVTGLANGNLTNENLKWEFTDQYDAGLELGLFDDRVSLTADVYYKRTEDLLLNVPIPLSTGFANRLTNIGNVENKGLELSLKTLNFDGKFKWESEFNFAMNRNKVLSLGGVKEQTFPDQFSGEFTGILSVGEGLGVWHGYQTDGIFSYEDFEADEVTLLPEVAAVYSNFNNNPILGDIKYVDRSGPNGVPDGIIDSNDKTIVARTQPKHFGSMYNSFSYGGFELGVFFTYKYKFDVVNGNRYRIVRGPGGNRNKPIALTDSWTPDNPDATEPRADYSTDRFFTDRSVEDGSFIRLQSVNIGYSLPTDVVEKLGLSSFKIYSNLDNVYVWTKYSGYDPEVSVARGQKAVTSANLDYGAYPRTMSFTFGVKAGF